MARIAIVEDSDVVRELMTDVLEARGYEIEAFGTVAAAREALSGEAPNLVITDVNLPDGSGLDIVALVRARHDPRELPILVISGLGAEADLMTGFAAGASDYLTKPVSNAELLAKCGLLLARARKAGSSNEKTRPLPLRESEKPGDGLPGGSENAFERYRIHSVLGRGSGGIVYKAADMADEDRLVALKVLPPLDCASEESRQRFLRETYSLSLIRHPNVVEVLDFGAAEGRLYYAMELVEGPTLAQRIRENGPASEEDTLSLLRGLSGALQALTDADLIHRDLKPANVVLEDGCFDRPVLVDFGLAKRPLDMTLTQTGYILGTPGYTSPECVRGGEIDARCDQFSLGLVARHACTGSEVFPNCKPGPALLSAIGTRPVPIPESLSGPLRSVLVRMTQINPKGRFPSCAAILAALDALAPTVAVAGSA